MWARGNLGDVRRAVVVVVVVVVAVAVVGGGAVMNVDHLVIGRYHRAACREVERDLGPFRPG